MRYGANFPHSIGTDPAAVRDYAQALEGAGFDYMLVIDHIAGVHRSRFGEAGPAFNYTSETPTHELFTLMAYVAGVTRTLELVPSVLLLPQRPTVLAAKQAAEVSILSNGRLRIVVGIGWNEHEYAVLGANFHNRGRRLEEQIEVMKALWTQPMVTYKGRWHDLDQICINPLPPKPIPLWMGGGAEDRLLRRYAKYADGWMPLLVPSVDPVDATNRLQAILKEEGRDPSSFGLDMRVNAGDGEAKDWVERARQLQAMGADHLAINAGFGGSLTPAQALQRITDARKAIAAELG